jgi:uncharacterized protein YndB with AHSA1/START domain
VPKVRRSRVVAAPADTIWALVADVRAQSRWWPRVSRVEGVNPQGFTQVLKTASGRAVRADQRFVVQEAPYVLAWAQQVEGTPFEKVLKSAQTTVRVAAEDDDHARVTIELRQKMRGMSGFAPFLVTRAGRRQLDSALDGIQALAAKTGA